MTDQKEDAGLGVICQAAYALRGPAWVAPAPVPLPDGWEFQGHLTAQDAILRGGRAEMTGVGRVYYGFVARSKSSPSEYIAAIRGTVDLKEWGENGEFALKKHPVAGNVETGFYDIYNTLQLDGVPADMGIYSKVGDGRLTVVGHSLGAAIGTYLTFDTAGIPHARVRGRFFASPRPGDGTFASAFDQTIADYASYAYELDVVPRVPFGFGYQHLPKMSWLKPHNGNAQIKFDLLCHHSMVSYVSMLDPSRYGEISALDPSCATCAKCSSLA